MKKITISAAFVALALYASSQNNTSPFPASGNVGIGTGAAQSAAVFNLQLHGTTNYSYNVPESFTGTFPNITVLPGYTVNNGVTSRLGLTNTNTGALSTDGGLIRMSETNFVIENLEKKRLIIQSGNATMTFSGDDGRVWMGATPSTATDFAKLNLQGESGINIRTVNPGKYGISFRMQSATDNAIQVMGTNGTTRNFAVKANGEVFARKYTTTLANIPDYVFDENYKLMPLEELRMYLAANKHLPNVPSAKEYEATGVDLGEMNRVLLEKTEELTLYILQLEERLQKLEERNK